MRMNRTLRITKLVLQGYTFHSARLYDYLNHGADDTIFRTLIMATYKRVYLRDTIFFTEHVRSRYQELCGDASYRLISLIFEFLKFGSLGIVAYIQSIGSRLEEILAWSQHPDGEKIKLVLSDVKELLCVRLGNAL